MTNWLYGYELISRCSFWQSIARSIHVSTAYNKRGKRGGDIRWRNVCKLCERCGISIPMSIIYAQEESNRGERERGCCCCAVCVRKCRKYYIHFFVVVAVVVRRRSRFERTFSKCP
ncbi:hypothetical protein VTP01DRAFT_1246 [Rhizomucor pusillus]|uniref:uncharacterized protein n=1 Tax=Rhizomucor pusillus TaxID=4840 RepID=UPI003743FDA8